MDGMDKSESDTLATLRRLGLLSQGSFRRARYEAVKHARGIGLTWEEIGDAMGVHFSSASRMYKLDERFVTGQD